MERKMAGTPLEHLPLSVRARNILHRMGIHSLEELINTPIDVIAQQRNLGTKTFDEIKSVLINSGFFSGGNCEGFSFVDIEWPSFKDEQLTEMSWHSIDELKMSSRPSNALRGIGCLTIDKVAQLQETDFVKMKGLGKKSIGEIRESVGLWAKENLVFEIVFPKDPVNNGLQNLMQRVTDALDPVVHLYWKQLLVFFHTEGLLDNLCDYNRDEAIKAVLLLPQVKKGIKLFWESLLGEEIIEEYRLIPMLEELQLSFNPELLITTSFETNILFKNNSFVLISRDTFLETYSKVCAPEDRATQILKKRLEGESLQDIGDHFELTRERVRQITIKFIRKFPLVFEDYYREPYEYFRFRKSQFMQAFPEIQEEGYEYLSMRYPHGKIEFTHASLEEYRGTWKEHLSDFLHTQEERDDKNTVSKTKMVMRVLMSNADQPLSIEEFEKEYYRYVERKGYPLERLRINIRSVGNHLRKAKNIVFNRDNKVRFCDANPKTIWETVDFMRYKNTVISSERIFSDYQDLMDDLDIRDGYELFYIIKASISLWDDTKFTIYCRRVPVMVMGEASEEVQAIKLLKEISPVAYYDYFEAYEERYGLRRESAQGNSVIANAIGQYYANGVYSIDVPFIDERDIPSLLTNLDKKTLWFVEEIEKLFEEVCVYTSFDAINAAAFKRIGYDLHAAYAYKSTYGTAINLFDKMVFSEDVVDLNELDRRLVNLSMFITALEKKKIALEYIETAPKILMSRDKIEEIYGLTLEEIRFIQSELSVYYDLPFFNGKSLWSKVQNYSLIKKLQGNDWLLTCILRQQEEIYSFSVAGGIILSCDGDSLNLRNICEWLSSVFGTMSIKDLEKKFNEMFGTRISSSKLAEKLKASGVWDKVVTDSMDDYIDGLVDTDIYEMDAEDLFQEEFF